MITDIQPRKTIFSRLKNLVLLIGLLAVIAVGVFFYAYIKIHRPVSSESVVVTFSVPKGASTNQVADELTQQGLINNKFFFVVYAKITGESKNIQAGDYQLDKKMSPAEILTVLASGKVTRNTKRLVILEGWTNKQIGKRIDEVGLATESQFTAALKEDYDFEFSSIAKVNQYEGFLFPDTYELDANLDAHDIVQRMLNNFELQFDSAMRAEIDRKNLSIEEVVILASIVEREVGRASSVELTTRVLQILQDERAKVASVFYNRLAIDMALQSDATVNYATGKSDRRAQYSDLEVDSPYNTYANIGLPPGPISNPGIDSIRAAINPADTDYLYFLSNQQGTAYFGRTLDEHNSNRQKYLD